VAFDRRDAEQREQVPRDGAADVALRFAIAVGNRQTAIALAVSTTIIINMGKAKYAWVTMLPLAFLSVTTLTAGWLNVTTQFWPMAVGLKPELHVQGALQSGLTVIMMICVVVILVAAVRKWLSTGFAGVVVTEPSRTFSEPS